MSDPLVVYLIVRESLHMGCGKIAAQCGHGIQKLMLHYFTVQVIKVKCHDNINLPTDQIEFVERTSHWLKADSRKVVLSADDESFERIKEIYPHHFLVKDNGLTEVEPGSETIICLHPLYKSTADKVIKRLHSLK
jgi:PTH2 family peptidyl-tRNA hydrolase